MNFIKTAAVVCALLVAAPAFAQVNTSSASAKKSYNTIGVSYTGVTFNPKDDDLDFLDTSFNGFSLGYLHGFGVLENRPLFIETGVKFTMGFASDSYDYDDYDATVKQTLASLSVPVNLAYKFGVTDKFAIKPYVGINLKLHMIGKATYSDDEDKISTNWFDKDDMDVVFKRFQLGWHIGAAFHYNSVSLGVDYGTDFTQIAKKVSSNTINVTLGYNF